MNSPNVNALQDRYPGLRSFSPDEQHLFFGRQKEIDDLIDLVRADQITVLFAKSGLGKSSLLNAGLTPRLEALHYRIIPVRFQQQIARPDDADPTEGPPALSENKLLNIVLNQLHGEFRAAWHGQTPPATFQQFYQPGAHPRKLWEEIKTHPFPNGAIPVFIFDQFEELFIFDQTQQHAFMGQLAELMNDQSPARIIQWLLKTDVDDRTMDMMDWSKQPLVKCLFSIRADRLFEMHKLKPMIPMILRNRYELLPLSDDCAREAIERPAQADGQFSTPKFTYNEGTRELIIGQLSRDKEADRTASTNQSTYREEICEIESSQLQIVCNYIENKIKEKLARGGEPVVGPDIIKDKKSINRILDKFYRNQLRQIGTQQEIEKVRLVLENDLLVDGHRVGLAAMKMRKTLGDDATADRLINKLIEVRLIRADDTHLGRTYELSHDTLIEPVEKVKKLITVWLNRKAVWAEKIAQAEKQREQELKFAREEKQRKRFQRLSLKLAIAISVAILAIFSALWFLANGHMNLAQANRDWAVDEYNAGNQRMAYRLWESSRDLVWWIPFYRNDRVDRRAAHWFAPFSGATTQFTTQHDSIQYVASLFQNNTFEVWRFSPADSTFVKFDSFYKDMDMPQINAMSATKLHLQHNHLILFKHDSLLQVFDLNANAKVFPKGPNYYPLCTAYGRSMMTGPVKAENYVYPFKPVLLAPNGNRLAVIDSSGHAHLFDLKADSRQDSLFEKLTSSILDFSLHDLQFSSTGDSVLIRIPDQNRFELLDLQGSRLVSTYTNTVEARFSPRGRYLLTISINGRLTIHDLQAEKSFSPSQLLPRVRIDALIVNQAESTLLISTSSTRSAAGKKYTLYSIDLEKPEPSVNPIATDVVRYIPFPLADQVLYQTIDSSIVHYNLNKPAKQASPVRLSAVTILQTGANHVLYTMNAPTGSEQGKLYLYNVTSGKRTDVTRFLVEKGAKFVFYAPEGPTSKTRIEDKKLIQASPDKLTFFAIDALERGGTAKSESPVLADNTRLKPRTLTISGPVISIKNQDDILLSFFVTNTNNRRDYIVNHIYPPLSKGDQEAAGL
ncbi:ATP-binding protein [Spirosoma aerophilum]